MRSYNVIINSSNLVLIEFYANWCPHCQRMKPVVEEISKALAGKVLIHTYDIDDNETLAANNGVDTVPAFLHYKGGELVWKYSGEITREEIENVIASYY